MVLQVGVRKLTLSHNHVINFSSTLSSCFESNLNGEYHVDPRDNDYFRGIIWELWRGDYSLRSARMMVRPKHLTGGKSKTVADP